MKNITPETEGIIRLLDEAMADVITQNEQPKRLLDARKKALEQTAGQISSYIDSYYDPKIIAVICQKKIDAIMQAKTVAELNEIVRSPRPVQYGGKIIDHPKYQFDEEELLHYCRASLTNVPGPSAMERMNVLFERIFGAPLDEYCRRQT